MQWDLSCLALSPGSLSQFFNVTHKRNEMLEAWGLVFALDVDIVFGKSIHILGITFCMSLLYV